MNWDPLNTLSWTANRETKGMIWPKANTLRDFFSVSVSSETWNNAPSTRCQWPESVITPDCALVTMKLRRPANVKARGLLEISTILPVRAITGADKSFGAYWLPRRLISMRRSKWDAMLRSRPSFWAEDGAGSGRRWQANRDCLMLLMSSLLPSHQHAAGFPLRGIMGAC